MHREKSEKGGMKRINERERQREREFPFNG
jgi:hypothetical protein